MTGDASLPEIPQTARAAVVPKAGAPAQIQQVPVTRPEDLKPGQCLVKIKFTGVCHSDLSICNDVYGKGMQDNLIGGHEGAGIIVAIGKGSETPLKIGSKVGIKYIADACLYCEPCKRGNECICENVVRYSGNTVPGTFQEYTVSYLRYVTPLPDNFRMDYVAPILCAGVTVLRALKNCNLQLGDYVVVPGAAGGLGSLAVQYAIAMGCKVVAIDTGAEKKKLCESYGASWIDFKETKNITDSVIQLTDGRGAHGAVVTSPKQEAYEQALEYIRPGGTLAIVGLPPNTSVKVPILETALSCKRIVGVFVGSREDAVQAVNIAATGRIVPRIAIDRLENLNDIYHRMEQGKIAGRVVIDMEAK